MILKTALQTDGVKIKKLVHDIDLVERLRKILFVEIVIPLPLSVIFLFNLAIARLGLDFALLLKILLGMIIGAAVLFTPFLFYVLINEKRYGWITIFFFMVVLPYIIILLIFYDFVLLGAWLLLPIILFYFYCFILKYSIADWLKDHYAHEEYKVQKSESIKRKQDEMRWSP